MTFYYRSLKLSKLPLLHKIKKVEMILKFPKCLHLEKLLLAYVIILFMPYNFCNHFCNIFISLKIAVIFKVDKVIASSCVCVCVRACVRACVRVCVCVIIYI